MINIRESEMNFGDFHEEDLFEIEKSELLKSLGEGVKTVEFILFTDSLQVYMAAVLKRYREVSEIGDNLKKIKDYHKRGICFILVIKDADIKWLAGPKAILERRLLSLRKIWGIEISVLNYELAKQYKLISNT